jgi:GWxTD domain-containing protein
MRTFKSIAFIGVISASLLVPILHAQNPPTSTNQSGTGQQGPTRKPPLTKQQQEKAKKELDNAYKTWLEIDVKYIITDAERDAFLRLSTNEEREQYIEQFWLRRDPTPDTPENEFKEEHYRRIAYANEHYASGVPGWKTDRGRIYIIWGKADSIESHSSGGFYTRTQQEGGGETSTFPFEIWHYNYLEGLGNNILLEFVDTSGSNEYHLSTDPEEKDALLYVPGAGLSEMENYGMADKQQRFQRSDGTHMPTGAYDTPGQNDAFRRYELAARIFVAPPVKNKEMLELVSSRIVRNQLPFDYRFDYLRITDDTINVPITIQLANRQLTFQNKEGVHSAQINIFGRISTLGDRVVQTFEDTLSRDFPDSLFQQYVTKQSIYQKTVPLRPGLYKLDIVVKDVQSGNVGVVNTRLAVPRFEQEKLDTSTLILADNIENVPSGQVGIGQFVLGDVKVRPQIKQEFFLDQKMGMYLQVYNIKVDDKTHKSNVTVHFRVTHGDQEVFQTTQTSQQMKQEGNELTIQSLLPLSTFVPGKYKLVISVSDQIGNETIIRGAEFTVKAPAETRAAAN